MARKRANNEGTVYKLPSGHWCAQLTLEGQRMSKTFGSQKEGLDWIRKLRGQIEDGLIFASTQISLSEYMNNWLASSKASKRQRTWDHYTQLSRSYVEPYLGELKLKDLRPDQVQRLYDLLLKQNVGRYTIIKVHTMLHAALKQAVKLGLASHNPTDGARPPRAPAEEMKILNESQASQLLLAANGTRLEALLHLALSTGMRQMELLGLKWMDLDWIRKTLQVKRQLERTDGEEVHFIQPKTRSGRRTIDLGTQTINVLRQHEQRQFIEKKAAGERWKEYDLIFSTCLGTPINARNLVRDFKRLLKGAGLPDIRFHDLRHTAASLMLNNGVPVLVVSRRLGHARASITLDVYAHLIPSMQAEAAEKIDELITPVIVQLSKTDTNL